jgi:hypothetical protein
MSVPRPILTVHGEDAILEIPGLLTLRAGFLSEGLFDPDAGGDPDEEDLYDVEVTHARDEILEPISFPRLMPASSRAFPAEEEWDDEAPANLPIERFLLVLAWELAHAHPTNWEDVCESARGWDSFMLEDALIRIPPEWTPQALLPELD